MPSRRTEASAGWDCLGLAIRDYGLGDRRAAVTVLRGDGVIYPMPARLFFREWRSLAPMERLAVRLCRGRVLDIGAGAGCHSLELQRRGLDVVALDASPHAVAAMRRRGVRQARRGDGLRPSGGPFDTLLLMMNGIAIVKSLAGLRRFLRRARRVVAPGGQMIFDTLDMRRDETSQPGVRRRLRQGRRYHGELGFRMRYRGRTGPRFQLLFIDPAQLAVEARRCGWRSQVVRRGEQGRYLARLTLAAAPRTRRKSTAAQAQR
jgi:SAM-dependent methyltransferase